jgi:hypothetical protein
MDRRSDFVPAPVAAIVILCSLLSCTPGPSPSEAPVVVARFRLEAIGLAASQARTWPGLMRDDRGLKLGGVFSALCHAPGDSQNVFYCAADRGPNDIVTIGVASRRTFPVPEYSPRIYKLRAEHDRLHIIDEIGIRTRGGAPVTGLPNTDVDETPYGHDGITLLPLNPNGLDVEGLAVARDGSFWIADEYRPSLARIAADGTVLTRLIPGGTSLLADTDVRNVLPAIYAKRRLNRGFEGLAMNSTDSLLFAAMESPLEFPDAEVGRASRMVRILVVDAGGAMPVAEHVYVAERGADLGGSAQDEIRLGDVACVNDTTLLVVERTQKVARVYRVDLERATNILDSRWSDSTNTTDPLEALTPEQLGARGIRPVSKTLLVDLSLHPSMPTKPEGLAIVNSRTLAIGNDNDFGFEGFGADGRAIHKDVPTVLTLIQLPQPLPLDR